MPSTPALTFSTSNKRNQVLICDGFVYHLNRTRPKIKYWRCKVRTCSAYIHTDHNDQYLGKSGEHDGHLPNPENIEIASFRHKLKERVINETTAIGKIYETELAAAGLSEGALVMTSSADEAKPFLNRLRRETTPPLPKSSSFEIPDGYTRAKDDSKYLFNDGCVRKKRVILFATNDQLRMLFSATHIMMDGTFSSCPPHFDQVFSLHCVEYGYNFPCVIGLLPGRSALVYKHVFNVLNEAAGRMNLQFKPTHIMSDFEKGLIKSIASHFPGAQHSGCFFHYTQSLYRHIQSLGLSSLYKDDSEIRSLCRHLMALPLLPVKDVQQAYDELNERIPAELEPLFEYFEGWWMKQVPLALWNVSNLQSRTNNNVEGWHSRFNKRVEKKHPNIWAFIEVLKTEEVHFKQQMVHMQSGKIKKASEKTCLMDQRLNQLRKRYDEGVMTLTQYHHQLSLLIGAKSI